MKPRERTRSLLIMHYQKYPLLKLCDLFKFLHQSSFGCEHLVSSRQVAKEFVLKEYEALVREEEDLIEPLDGAYSRVHLCCLRRGVLVDDLVEAFCQSAKNEPLGKKELLKKLEVLKELIYENHLPFSPEEFERAVIEWKAKDFSPLHHSKEFRANYKPAYRVIANQQLSWIFP